MDDLMLRLSLVALGVLMGWVVWRSTKWEQPSRIYTWPIEEVPSKDA